MKTGSDSSAPRFRESIGEYLGKLYVETKSRPRYFVEQVIGESSIDSARLQSVLASTGHASLGAIR